MFYFCLFSLLQLVTEVFLCSFLRIHQFFNSCIYAIPNTGWVPLFLKKVLYIDLRPGHAIPKWCTGRKWHIPMTVMRRNRVGGLGWKYGTKQNPHGTLIDWCTGREWLVNYMTVISVWWRSNMPFQRLSGRLNYYIARWRQEVSELGTREVGDKLL